MTISVEKLECICEKLQNVFKRLRDIITEIADYVMLYVEIIKDYINQHTSLRYKAVKFLSKYTGIEMCRIWRATRFIWLARDCI